MHEFICQFVPPQSCPHFSCPGTSWARYCFGSPVHVSVSYLNLQKPGLVTYYCISVLTVLVNAVVYWCIGVLSILLFVCALRIGAVVCCLLYVKNCMSLQVCMMYFCFCADCWLIIHLVLLASNTIIKNFTDLIKIPECMNAFGSLFIHSLLFVSLAPIIV